MVLGGDIIFLSHGASVACHLGLELRSQARPCPHAGSSLHLLLSTRAKLLSEPPFLHLSNED